MLSETIPVTTFYLVYYFRQYQACDEDAETHSNRFPNRPIFIGRFMMLCDRDGIAGNDGDGVLLCKGEGVCSAANALVLYDGVVSENAVYD